MNRALILIALAATSCTAGPWARTPRESDISHIEQRLQNEPCVGEIGKWRRTYAYASKPWLIGGLRWFDYRTVDFEMSRSRIDHVRPGRIIYRGFPEPWLIVSEARVSGALGSYDLRSERLLSFVCLL